MAVDAFLKIYVTDDQLIEGESRDKAHRGEIELLSFSWGVENSGSFSHGSGGGEGKASFHKLMFSSHISKASPLLAKACATGQHIKEGVITVRKAGGSFDFYKAQFSDVFVSSFDESASEGAEDDGPMSQISMNFDKIEIDYKVQNPNGSVGDEVFVAIDLSPVPGDPAGG